MKTKHLILSAIAFLLALPSLAQAGAKSSSSDFDEYLDFNDNLVPPGWAITFPYGGPGRNAQVANERFQIGIVDTYAALEKAKTLPPGETQLHIAFECDIKDVNPGMGYQIHILMADGTDFLAGFSKEGFGIKLLDAYAGHYSSPEFLQTYPPNYQTYTLDALFEANQITLTVTGVMNGKVYLHGVVSVPGLDITQLQTVRLFGIMTTGHKNPSPAWIDNAVIEALP